MTRTEYEGDEAGRCGGCGSRNMLVTRPPDCDTLHAVCKDCLRLQEIETRDWPLSEMCDNCAFRKGSPERADPYRWAEVQETLANGSAFHCHKGLNMTIKGTDCAFDPPEASKGHVTICAGWFATYAKSFGKRQEGTTTDAIATE